MPPIDKYLYLDCSVSTIIEHMRQRGREYEDDLDLDVRVRAEGALRRMGKDAPAGPDAAHQHGLAGEYDLEQIVRFLEA
ncbi:MAG: hypothetical protein ACLU3I_00440 [Acutalibacteraceae bacterium]